MKATVITNAVRLVDRAAARVECWVRRGEVRVVSVLCTDCGQWVKPDEWNPVAWVCEVCVSHLRRAAVSGRYPNSGYRAVLRAAQLQSSLVSTATDGR